MFHSFLFHNESDKIKGERFMKAQHDFCTCDNIACPLHPTKHDKGCSLCIQKNLKLKEIPNCFFHLLENAQQRQGDSFEDFAKLVLKENG